jgi:hypothetical protein
MDQAMLDIDAPRIGTRKITNQLLVRRRILEWIVGTYLRTPSQSPLGAAQRESSSHGRGFMRPLAWRVGLTVDARRDSTAHPAATPQEASGIDRADQVVGDGQWRAGDQAGEQFAGERRPDDAAGAKTVDQIESR